MHASGMQIDVATVIQEGAARTDAALERLLPPVTQVPASIHGAMRHSVFAGGKRLRPVLAAEAARAIGAAKGSSGLPEGIEELGAAIEMIHTYSLIHDDLPALDNDDLRRGKPTCHVAFGEAIAILAGDALQTLAYQTLARLRCAPERAIRIVGLIAEATGTVEGMIGGQVLDLEGEHTRPTAEMVQAIHRAKTGALIRVSIVAGGVYAGADEGDVQRLTEFGTRAGLAFQIVDDVLDLTATEEVLGKPVASDLREGKATLAVIHSLDHGTAADRQTIQRVLDDRSFEHVRREQIQQILARNGSVVYAMAAADRYAEQGRQALAGLPDSDFKRALLWVPDFVVAREK
jgi:geranylgeranyl diphosphate synthase, type II